jgi:hypothetical protein
MESEAKQYSHSGALSWLSLIEDIFTKVPITIIIGIAKKTRTVIKACTKGTFFSYTSFIESKGLVVKLTKIKMSVDSI